MITELNRLTAASQGEYLRQIGILLEENRELKVRNLELLAEIRRIREKRGQEAAHG